MNSSSKPAPVKPRIIIHGGAGNITRANLPEKLWKEYSSSLLSILHDSSALLARPNATALDIATHAVTQLENNPLFNAGHGAVFTRTGEIELEASVMVSRGYRKRGVGVMGLKRVKHPIQLAKEMLIRGDDEDGQGGGAQGHCQLTGDICEDLAKKWGLEIVEPGYFWTRKRWEEHRKGLGLSLERSGYEWRRDWGNGYVDFADDPSWNGTDYLPQGTVGCVVLDSTGTLCVATSTGGITNKLPGRVGDTPTLGAGFWAEEWQTAMTQQEIPRTSPLTDWASVITSCIPSLATYLPLPGNEPEPFSKHTGHRAAAISGTGNGDSFLRTAAVRTASAIARFSPGEVSLQNAVTAVAGPEGMLQRSAEDRWHKTGEGEGGMIGIELTSSGVGRVVADFNCGGLFRAWLDDNGRERCMVFREEY